MMLSAKLLRSATTEHQVDSNLPTVSIVVAVYNEERVLCTCLDALLKVDYPSHLVEILAGSDGSDDKTNEILLEYDSRHPQFHGHIFSSRRGKIPVMNDLVPRSAGDIILFTDADVTFSPDIVLSHVRHYLDEHVGGVAGTFHLAGSRKHGPLGAEQDYMSLEVLLRKSESDLHSTVGIFGGNYSLRRSLWQPLPNLPICDELYSTLRIIRAKERMLFDSKAIAVEQFARSMRDEFQRKKRFASRGFSTLARFPDLLSPFSGLPAAMLWSHKILRWLTPFMLFSVVLGTVVSLLSGAPGWCEYAGYVEGLGVLLIALGGIAEYFSIQISVLRRAYWFFCMNLAFAIGTINFLFGREKTFWAQPTRIAPAPSVEEQSADPAFHHVPSP